MKITIIDGDFSTSDTIAIIESMIQVKIKFHEGKIGTSSHEEDIKWRESKIKKLQQDLREVRSWLQSIDRNISVHSDILFE